MNDAELVRELKAVGIQCEVCNGEIVSLVWNGPVGTPAPTEAELKSLADLVAAAYEQPDGSDAVAALKAHLGAASEEWKAYVAARNRLQRLHRRELYRAVSDALLFEVLENAECTQTGGSYEITVSASAWDNWLAAKAAIREELPYAIDE